jgi:hypothetical protein
MTTMTTMTTIILIMALLCALMRGAITEQRRLLPAGGLSVGGKICAIGCRVIPEFPVEPSQIDRLPGKLKI